LKPTWWYTFHNNSTSFLDSIKSIPCDRIYAAIPQTHSIHSIRLRGLSFCFPRSLGFLEGFHHENCQASIEGRSVDLITADFLGLVKELDFLVSILVCRFVKILAILLEFLLDFYLLEYSCQHPQASYEGFNFLRLNIFVCVTAVFRADRSFKSFSQGDLHPRQGKRNCQNLHLIHLFFCLFGLFFIIVIIC